MNMNMQRFLIVFVTILLCFDASFAIELRTITGFNNSLTNPKLGQSHTELGRFCSTNTYSDGLSIVETVTLPSARLVSNQVHAPEPPNPFSQVGASEFFTFFAQFLAHDFGWTPATFHPGSVRVSGNWTEVMDPSMSIPIPVPLCDPTFDPFCTGNQSIPTMRAAYNRNAASNITRQFNNEVTQWLDCNTIYGSDDDRAATLRSFRGGTLKTTPGIGGEFPPFNLNNVPNQNDAAVLNNTALFLCGDQRCNENPGLLAIHIIWMREHNRVARTIQCAHPEYDDETIYQEARRWVIAELQSIVVNEYLPILLGPNYNLGPYQGYNASGTDDLSFIVSLEFEMVTNRFGHSQLAHNITLLDENRDIVRVVFLKDIFSLPSPLEQGIDYMVRGMAYLLGHEIDHWIVPDVRNFLFGPSPANPAVGLGGLDLAAVNIQRGRDTGVAHYNTMRRELGLEPITSFSNISSNADVVNGYSSIYSSVDLVDAWSAAISEDRLENAAVGELIAQLARLHFSRARDHDRFWFENNQFTEEELAELRSIRMSDIILLNTGIKSIQQDVFHATTDIPEMGYFCPISPDGTVGWCKIQD